MAKIGKPKIELVKMSRGEKTAAVSALLLFALTFVTWFGVEVGSVSNYSGDVPGGGNAWDTLDWIPILLLAAIVSALVVALVRLTDADLEPSFSLNTVVAILGALAVVAILFRIVSPPGIPAYGGVEVDTTLQLGIFFSLVAAGGIAYGGYSGMREEGLSFADSADKLAAQQAGPAASADQS